jgi:hypothetical protein
MTEHKPTYEQLEKAVALFDHTIDSILEHAKYGSSLPSNATLMAQSHRLMVEDTESAACELRHILAPPVPAYEEVEEIVGWVNVYQREDGSIYPCGIHVDEPTANLHAGDRRISCQPIKVTVQREKKRPVERSVTISEVIWKQLSGTNVYFPSHGTRAVDWSQFLNKKGSLTFTYPEE